MNDNLISTFKKDGYVKIGNILDQNDLEVLKKKSRQFLESSQKKGFEYNQNVSNDYFRPVLDNADWSVLENIIGLSEDFDRVMEKFFSHPTFKAILENTIGKNYKLWTCSIRLAKGKDNGLGFHNDSPGEVGITILIEDQLDEKGTTSVIPGSHEWPVTSQEIKFESIPTKLVKPFSKAVTGLAGDTYFFFKKTLHGRVSHNSSKSGIAIMIGIFPVGYCFTPYKVPKSVLSKVGPETRKLMSDDSLEQINDEGKCIITGNREEAYIDKISNTKLSFYNPWNFLRLYPLLVVYPVQKIKKIFRNYF